MPPPVVPLMIWIYRGLAITLLITRVIVIGENGYRAYQKYKYRRVKKKGIQKNDSV